MAKLNCIHLDILGLIVRENILCIIMKPSIYEYDDWVKVHRERVKHDPQHRLSLDLMDRRLFKTVGQ